MAQRSILLLLLLMALSACSLPPFWQAVYLALRAQAQSQAERYDLGIADLDAAIELMPNSPVLYVLRGQMHVYLYQWDQALADYQQAIRLAPSMTEVYYHRAILYSTRNEPMLALADFERYLVLEPAGIHAEQAHEFISIIQAQQDALGN